MGGTELGQIIRHARKLAGLRLEDVAERIGVTAGALSHIESGRRLPTPHNAAAIARVLGIPEEELLLALDHEHSSRRRDSVESWRSSNEAMPDGGSAATVFSEQPIEALFGRSRMWAEDEAPHRLRSMSMPAPRARQDATMAASSDSRTPRFQARWSEDTAERIVALDELATNAAEAIRTLRGLLDDEDPAVAHEARRLLRELDVRGPGE